VRSVSNLSGREPERYTFFTWRDISGDYYDCLIINNYHQQGGIKMDINKLTTKTVDTVKQNRVNFPNETKFDDGRSKIEDQDEKNINISKERIENLIDTLNAGARSVDRMVSFSFHEKTNRVIMKILDEKTREVIREIPPKEMIKILEHIHGMIGMFVDEQR
jgi:flagellar protein FlaG